MTLSPLDIILFTLAVALIARCTLVGFVAEFFSKAAVIVALAGAVLFFGAFSAVVARVLGTASFSRLIAFLVIFLALYLAAKLLQSLAGSLFESETMANLDRALGFFLGITEGVLAAVMIVVFLRVQTWFDASFLLDGSLVAHILNPFLVGNPGLLTGFMPAQ